MSADPDQVVADFKAAVNMPPSALEKWLTSEDSRSVGWSGDGPKKGSGGGESVGHASGRRIVELKRKKKADLTDADLAHMRKVAAYVKRHLAQGAPKEDVRHSRWRYSLMNWGHDPLRKGRPARG